MYLKMVTLFESFVSISLSVDFDFFSKLSWYFATCNHTSSSIYDKKNSNFKLTSSALRHVVFPSHNFELITLAHALSRALKNRGSFLKVSLIRLSYF